MLVEPGNRDDEQVAVRHADASGGNIRENQHEEETMRDVQVSIRGSEAASEEQTDKWRKTVRFDQEAPNASASSDPHVAVECLASGETESRPGDDVQISALDTVYEKDVRKSRYFGEVLNSYRGEDAVDLKRSELNELVESVKAPECTKPLAQGCLNGENMCAWCRHKRGRFECTHGGVFESTQGWSSPVLLTKKSSRRVLTWSQRGSPKKPLDHTHFQFENSSRTTCPRFLQSFSFT